MLLERGPLEMTADVVVIGGGAAATMAAIEAKRHGLEVVLIDKGRMGKSGTSPRCGGGGNDWALLPPEFGGDPRDSHDAQLQDCVTGGQYLNAQEMTEIFNREALERMVETESLGIVYARRPDGKYDCRKIMAFSCARGVGRALGGSDVMMRTMREQVLARGIKVFDYVMITGLLKADGRIAAAFGVSVKTGKLHLFRGKSFILAAGSATGLYKHPTCENELTGDAYALAYQAGAELMNMEFLQFSLATKVRGIFIRKIGGIKPLVVSGARWINALGERVMERYDPERLELTDWWRHPWAIHRENVEGRGPVHVDLSQIPEEQREKWEYGFGEPWQVMRFLGLDPKKEKLELIVGLHTFLGGARINDKGETNVPGLYAAGESAGQGGIFGADRVGGGIPAAQVIGHRAGKHAALFSRQEGLADVSKGAIKEAEDGILSFMRNKGEDPYALETHVKDTSLECLGMDRHTQRLEKAINEFSQLRRDAPSKMRVDNLVDLQKALEVPNLALSGEMVSRSALMRTETRGQHRRDDYPDRDDKNWLRWIVLKEDGGRMSLSTIPVPIERYKIKPKG